MKFEYLIYNLVIIAGPLALSFEKGVHYISRWKYFLPAIVVVLIPFIIWDSLVTGKHWWFNENYTLDFRLAGLPLEEWLFFITVPFACLFVWEIIRAKSRNPVRLKLSPIQWLLIAGFIPGIFFLFDGRQYTGITLFALGITALLDMLLKTDILLRPRTYLYLAIITAFILIFNGFLTARPVVLYNNAFQLSFHIFTIPIEDFGYGYSLILLNTILYDKFKGVTNE
ncbi:MAG: lycopene cyclase domain-containing protein [Calditrichia bacterium]